MPPELNSPFKAPVLASIVETVPLTEHTMMLEDIWKAWFGGIEGGDNFLEANDGFNAIKTQNNSMIGSPCRSLIFKPLRRPDATN